ncbi:MAG: hypothetical protein ABR527_04510 [Gemmatimonadota bacterium]
MTGSGTFARAAPWASVLTLANIVLAIVASPIAAGAQEPPATEPLLIDRGAGAISIRVVPEPRAGTAGPGEITVGDPFWVTVETEGPGGHRLLPQSLIDAYAPHPELAVVGSDRRDGLWRLQIALFRPGDVVLPTVRARVVTERGDTLGVPVRADTMRVRSVLAPGDTVLADIKPLWTPREFPAWIWAFLALALAIIALLWWRRRRRRGVVAAPGIAPRDAYREARQRIVALGAEPEDPERAVAAAAGIGDALRGYLANGWGIAAREKTTLELLPTLPLRLASERAALGSVLSLADLAKFARVAPARGEVPSLATRALALLDRLDGARHMPAEVPPVIGGEERAS